MPRILIFLTVELTQIAIGCSFSKRLRHAHSQIAGYVQVVGITGSHRHGLNSFPGISARNALGPKTQWGPGRACSHYGLRMRIPAVRNPSSQRYPVVGIVLHVYVSTLYE